MKLSRELMFSLVVAGCIIAGAAYTIQGALTGYNGRVKATECMLSALPLKNQFVDFLAEKKRFPESLTELDLPKDLSKSHVEAISVIPSGFMITCDADAHGITVSYLLRQEGDNYVWSCSVGLGGEDLVGRCM